MKILKIEQNSEEWMEWRRPNIGGSDSKDVKPWISEYSKFIHISPDGADEGDQPKNAFEGKSFDTHKHLMTIYFDLLAKEDMEYNPIDSLPKDNQDQAIKYFAVNDSLETLHWALFNDFVAIPGLEHYIIEKRDEIIKFMRDKIGVK